VKNNGGKSGLGAENMGCAGKFVLAPLGAS
jgi:hypothetical protein